MEFDHFRILLAYQDPFTEIDLDSRHRVYYAGKDSFDPACAKRDCNSSRLLAV